MNANTPSFPTTLREIARPGCYQIIAEYACRRYYIASETCPREAELRARRRLARFPKASVYLWDRADSTHIDGDERALWKAYNGR